MSMSLCGFEHAPCIFFSLSFSLFSICIYLPIYEYRRTDAVSIQCSVYSVSYHPFHSRGYAIYLNYSKLPLHGCTVNNTYMHADDCKKLVSKEIWSVLANYAISSLLVVYKR